MDKWQIFKKNNNLQTNIKLLEVLKLLKRLSAFSEEKAIGYDILICYAFNIFHINVDYQTLKKVVKQCEKQKYITIMRQIWPETGMRWPTNHPTDKFYLTQQGIDFFNYLDK